MSLIKEFKEFATRGNVIDLAVAVIIGTAFNPIVKSLVDDIIMPPIGMVLGKVDFSNLKITLQKANEAAGVSEVAIRFGAFLNTVIGFLIVAFAVFMLIKGINSVRRKEAEKPAAPPAPTTEEKLLTEIRDLLKARQ
ncbi:MAG: large-conductance mechanosensitive channel protein MscL [Planctomycetota bacterium]|nr:large-conductance mechanosensitive channel protein MscL [Planctomycetota bacterium]